MNHHVEIVLGELWKKRFDRCVTNGCSSGEATVVAAKFVDKVRQMYYSQKEQNETDASEGHLFFDKKLGNASMDGWIL